MLARDKVAVVVEAECTSEEAADVDLSRRSLPENDRRMPAQRRPAGH